MKRERALRTGQFNKNTEKDNYSSWNAFLISYWHLESTAKFKRKALKNIWGHPVQWKERNFLFTGKGNKIHYDLLALRKRHLLCLTLLRDEIIASLSLSLINLPTYLSFLLIFPLLFPSITFTFSLQLALFYLSSLFIFPLPFSHFPNRFFFSFSVSPRLFLTWINTKCSHIFLSLSILLIILRSPLASELHFQNFTHLRTNFSIENLLSDFQKFGQKKENEREREEQWNNGRFILEWRVCCKKYEQGNIICDS